MLLVPESKMKLRDLFRVLVVFPFTVMPAELSDQVELPRLGSEA